MPPVMHPQTITDADPVTLYTVPLYVSPSQMISGPEKPAEILNAVDIWLVLHMFEC